jgi:phenylacetyl-CoA:acceptor oxidoreductase
MDEVTDFADIILPDQLELESLVPIFSIREAGHRKGFMMPLHQPIVEPYPDIMNINNVMTELAYRAGFIDDFNKEMNKLIGYSENDANRLQPGKKYSWEEVVDRKCKFYTNGKYDLEWFKKNYILTRPVSIEEQYDIHFNMKAKKLRYPVPYMEVVKKSGDELNRNLAQKGIDWWPTDEYTALPVYFPPIIEDAPAEHNFYVVNCRLAPTSWGANVGLPWVNEVAAQLKGVGDVLMNVKTGKTMGIKDGDMIWIESTTGKIKQRVKLCQGIRPDCLLISGQFGQWAMPVAKETGRATISTLLPISIEWTDKMTGNQQWIVVKAKVYKAA